MTVNGGDAGRTRPSNPLKKLLLAQEVQSVLTPGQQLRTGADWFSGKCRRAGSQAPKQQDRSRRRTALVSEQRGAVRQIQAFTSPSTRSFPHEEVTGWRISRQLFPVHAMQALPRQQFLAESLPVIAPVGGDKRAGDGRSVDEINGVGERAPLASGF